MSRNTEFKANWARIVLPCLLVGAGFFTSAGAQVPVSSSNPAETSSSAGTTAEQMELQKKLGAATATAQKDPGVQAAFQKATKTLREADELMYKKIKQIDPSLTTVVDQILKAKYPNPASGN